MAREFIEKQDTLNDGREKINQSIERAYSADEKADSAIINANEAKTAAQNAERIQDQFDQVVISGDSSVEAAQARVGATGEIHTTLKKRIDTQEFVVSKTVPPNTSFWFEDRGDSGLEVSTGSGVSIANAILSDDEIDDKTKLWFDK